MLISESRLRRLIKEVTEEFSHYTTEIIFFYPGLRPGKSGGADNVVEELDRQLSSISSDPGSVKKEDTASAAVRRINQTALFIIAKDHKVPWKDLEKVARDKSGAAYDGQNVKKYLAGYSAGTLGVVDAQNSGTSFSYTHLADPWPDSKAKYDKLTYRKENWKNYDSYPGKLESMINNNKESEAEEMASDNYNHPDHMKNAIKELLLKII